jgi:serine/threonine protein kinase
MLRKEFSIGVGLDHPNIVRLLDFGYMDSIGWYIQMEYIEGLTLEQFLDTKPSVATRRSLLYQLIDALSFLHERQIIHRDIKPTNILVTRNGSTIKLIDFGVSDTDDYVTFKQPAGSMAYIAPEQLAGQTIDNRADIYAFGRILQLVFPHRYHFIAHRCTRTEVTKRYPSCSRVARAIRNADRVRIGLPLSILLLFIPCAIVWGFYADYQQFEHVHFNQESQLFAHIDSLSILNDKRQTAVDSLNRIVDSLVIKANSPSPRELMQQKTVDSLNLVVEALVTKAYTPTPNQLMQRKAKEVHAARYAALREAVKNGKIKAKWELSNMNYETANSEFDRTMHTIKDPFLKEAFREAYYAIYLHERNPLYDSLYNALPEKLE